MKLNKTTIVIALILILAIAAILYKFLSENPSQVNSKQQIIANYKGGVVTSQQVELEINKLIIKNPNLKGITFDSLNASQKEMLIKEIVLKEIAYKEAKKRRLDKSEEYQQALKLVESELLQQKLFVKLAEDARKEDNVKKNYDKLVKEMQSKKDIRLSYISVKTESDANAISTILAKNPNSFSDQARLKSTDKAIAQKGGDLGFVLEDAIPAEVIKTVKTMKKGQISNPMLLGDKWIIVKIEDERAAQVVTFEEAKDNLAKSLAAKALQDFITKSLDDAKINIVVK